ncbi:hypothetical protein B0H12DRAFT_1225041 [Mycena haematopus]|nr:hypothetical protein B0H12DRAFT_1225041 [Mycena haematopus]
MGLLQAWSYFAKRPTDVASVKWTVLLVVALETIQVIFFFRSSYFRFVERFGQIQLDLIWDDSLQLLAAYLSAFIVQLYFVSRIHKLTKGRTKFSLSAFGIYFIVCFMHRPSSVDVICSHSAACWLSCSWPPGLSKRSCHMSYDLSSSLEKPRYKVPFVPIILTTPHQPVTTLQSASSLVCDLLITLYLCLFLKSQKGDMIKTNSMMDMLIHDAINRGVLTSLSSGLNMVLFLALPDTFWFFLGLAPNSKFYMNSMLATLNAREHIRDKISANDKGWNSIRWAHSRALPRKFKGKPPLLRLTSKPLLWT